MTTFMAYQSEKGLSLDYAHSGDAGMDLRASQDCTVHPMSRETVPTGIHIELPPGTVGYVMPRSGLAKKHGVTVLNSPGVVDSGYRGEIMVTLYNTSIEPFVISQGDRIAQLIVAPYTHVKPVLSDRLSDSERGANGFGSTGVK